MEDLNMEVDDLLIDPTHTSREAFSERVDTLHDFRANVLDLVCPTGKEVDECHGVGLNLLVQEHLSLEYGSSSNGEARVYNDMKHSFEKMPIWGSYSKPVDSIDTMSIGLESMFDFTNLSNDEVCQDHDGTLEIEQPPPDDKTLNWRNDNMSICNQSLLIKEYRDFKNVLLKMNDLGEYECYNWETLLPNGNVLAVKFGNFLKIHIK